MDTRLLTPLSDLEKECILNPEVVTETCRLYSYDVVEIANTLSENDKEEAEQLLMQMARVSLPIMAIYLYSVSLSIRHNNRVFEEMLEYIVEKNGITGGTALYYLYYQCFHLAFKYNSLSTSKSQYYIWKMLSLALDKYKDALAGYLAPIKKDERTKGLVFVVTDQFIEYEHGPSKTAADRCKVLIEKCNKRVMLINTAECLAQSGSVPFYGFSYANYNPEYLDKSVITWKETSVPFFQCENNMPNTPVLKELLALVMTKKPEYIVAIGGTGLTVNLLAQMVPALTVGLCPSDISPSFGLCQTLTRNIYSSDIEMLRNFGFGKENIIESIFTSSLKEQEGIVTRSELGISEDAFVCVIIGARLNAEMTAEFLAVLEGVNVENIVYLILGKADAPTIGKNADAKLLDHMIFKGLVDDVLSYLDVCNLYINPQRKGGGTSSVEAMSKGVPIVTLPDGDVAVNAGEDFWVDDYEKMARAIERYADDAKWRGIQSEKAIERAQMLLDSEKEFSNTIREFESRIDKIGW